MTRDNVVVPFRRRRPTQQELDTYHMMTRHWSPALRRLLCPQYYEADAQQADAVSGRPSPHYPPR
jgi:hypothetical protein